MAACDVHLVGSINLPNARAVFESVSEAIGDVACRIPDGETDSRTNWIVAQVKVLETVPWLERIPTDDAAYSPKEGRVQFRMVPGAERAVLELPRLGYADFAAASFAIFSELKAAGRIGRQVRFQVSLPTPFALTRVYMHPSIRVAIEPVVERAVVRELELILAAVPAAELAVQWDVASEMASVEGLSAGYFEPLLPGLGERLARYAEWVPTEVPVGFHLCYGDVAGVHFKEPDDAAQLARVIMAIMESVHRVVDWIHIPVPIERADDAYFAPLDAVKLPHETMLYLGLIHKEDGLEGAKRRIAAAKRHIAAFGIGTECGMARDAGVAEVPGLLALHRAAAELL